MGDHNLLLSSKEKLVFKPIFIKTLLIFFKFFWLFTPQAITQSAKYTVHGTADTLRISTTSEYCNAFSFMRTPLYKSSFFLVHFEVSLKPETVKTFKFAP